MPVLYQTGMPLDKVIDTLTDEMHASRDRLDIMAGKLDVATRADSELNAFLMKFIDGIRIMDTGTLIYSYVLRIPCWFD